MAASLLLVVNDPDFFLSHRLPIALEARNAGYNVHIATPITSTESQIEPYGFSHHQIPLSRSGTNLIKEFQAFFSLIRLFQHLQPDIVHLVTIKPVVYGGIAGQIARVPAIIAAVSGLGSTFVSQGLKAFLIRSVVGGLYRLAFRHRNLEVIFQNPSDREALIRTTKLSPQKTTLIRGSGVDLTAFPESPEPDSQPVVCFAARLLREKGIFEFIEAARLLESRGVKARFWVVGDPDPGNPSSVDASHLDQWRKEANVEVIGYRKDIPDVFAQSSLIVLPSYREGLPKTLIEAAAAGRAVVTTDVPGCRDAITPDETGLLVPVRDVEALADAIQYLLEHPEERKAMGEAGRRLAEDAFDINKVVDQHLRIYDELLANIAEHE